MDRVKFVTDERLDVPDAHAFGDLPAELFNRLCREFFSGRELVAAGVNGNRVGIIRNWTLTRTGDHTVSVSRNADDGLLFDAQGRPVGGPYSAPTRTVNISPVPGPATYNVNVRYLEVDGDEVDPNGEAVTATRKKWNRVTETENSITTTPRRLDSWEVQLVGGVVDATVLDAAVDGPTADAGWITLGTVAVDGAGVITIPGVTVPDRHFYRAWDWTGNTAGRVQAAVRSLKDLYDALAANLWELKAKRGTDDLPNGAGGIDGWFRGQLSGLTRRGFIFPSDITGWAGPEMRVDAGAAERGRVRVYGTDVADVYLMPGDAATNLYLGRNATDQRARAVLENLAIVPTSGVAASDIQGNASMPVGIYARSAVNPAGAEWIIGDDWGHIVPRVSADFAEDFLSHYGAAVGNDFNNATPWELFIVGGGASWATVEQDAGALGAADLFTDGGVIDQGVTLGLNKAVLRLDQCLETPPNPIGIRALFRVRRSSLISGAGATPTIATYVGFMSIPSDPTSGFVVYCNPIAGNFNWRVQALLDDASEINVDLGVAATTNYVWIDIRIRREDLADVYIGLGPGASLQGPFTINCDPLAVGRTWTANPCSLAMACVQRSAAGAAPADRHFYVDRVMLKGRAEQL